MTPSCRKGRSNGNPYAGSGRPFQISLFGILTGPGALQPDRHHPREYAAEAPAVSPVQMQQDGLAGGRDRGSS